VAGLGLAACLVLAVSLVAPLPADARGYAFVGVGVVIPSNADVTVPSLGLGLGQVDTSSGFAFAGGLGNDFGLIRTELRVDVRRGDVDGVSGAASLAPFVPRYGDIGVLSVMPAVSVDLPLPVLGFEPHVGVGLGGAQLRDTTFEDWAFAWTLEAGLHRPLFGPVGFDLAYRYTGLADGFALPGGAAFLEWSDSTLLATLRLSWGWGS
jgi:opacity protein-like surface antigen